MYLREIIKKSFFILLFLLSSTFVLASSDMEFALKLAKDGYPELALKYLDMDAIKSNPDKEGRNKVLCEIYIQMAKNSRDQDTRANWIKKAVEVSKGIQRTAIEKADFSFSLANQIRLALKELGLTDAQKSAISQQVIPYFEDAKIQYKSYVDTNKEKFEEFIEKAMDDKDGKKFQQSAQGKKDFEEVYLPYVVSAMRYFECVIEKANVIAKGDSSRCAGLEKAIEDADALSYIIDAPVPSATISTYVARIYGLLVDFGVNPQENQTKAMEKFKEVFEADSGGNRQDASIIRDIKAKAINGLLEMALRTGDFNSALDVIDRYTSSNAKEGGVMPQNFKFTIDDFEVLLNGITLNAKAYKVADDKVKDKYQRNLDKLKLLLDKAADNSNSPIFWKKKIISYATDAYVIMGKDISDPMLIIQSAEDKKSEQKFKEALELYEKALAGRISGTDRISKKPKWMFSAAFCAYKLEDWSTSTKIMKSFFDEFPYKDAKLKAALNDQYIMSSKLYYSVASKLYAQTKTAENETIMLKSLDILEIFNPEGAIFNKIFAFRDSGNFIDAIKLSGSIKSDAVDYDKALYLKALTQYNYAYDEKKKNNDSHSELSMKLSKDAYASFQELLKFFKEDKSDILQEKKESRKTWEREAKRLSAFVQVSMEDYSAGLQALKALDEEYKKNPEEKDSSNRLYILQYMLSALGKLMSTVKEENAKLDLVKQYRTAFEELKSLGLNAFTIKDSNKNPEERKKEFVSNYGMVLGMALISFKDSKLAAEGRELLTQGKQVENLDLFLARKFLELKDYENASISLERVLKEFKDKGWSNPLTPEDFTAVKAKIISDETRTFFLNYYEIYAFPPQKGGQANKNTRDYSRLMRNLNYLLADKPNQKFDSDEEKKTHDFIIKQLERDKALASLKESGALTGLKEKLNNFLVYLGIIDDLAICNLRTKNYEPAIKYLEELRVNYPGVLTEDKKLADTKLEYGKSLISDKATLEKGNTILDDAYKMYMEIRDRVQNNVKLYNEINEKRLIVLTIVFKYTQDKTKLDTVLTALKLLFPNEEVYAKYTNLFALLEDMGQLPIELKPLTPEEIRARNEANEQAERANIEKIAEQKYQEELKQLELRRNKAISAPDAKFLPAEMHKLDDATLDLYLSYYDKLKGAKKLSGVTESSLLDAFNVVLLEPEMYKMLSDVIDPKDQTIAKQVKEITDYLAMQGVQKSMGSMQMVTMNRLLLEAAFPQLPKAYEKKVEGK